MFLFSVFEAIMVVVGLVFALPWTLILLPVERRSALLVALTTFALSLGALTVWLLVLALVGRLTPGASSAGIVVMSAAGILMAAQRGDLPLPVGLPHELQRIRGGSLLLIGAVLITLGMMALITFDALYWPFSDSDAVAIYADHSRAIFQSGTMPEGEGLYESYPMLLPLSYVYTYLSAGHINEYLARIVVAALAVGSFGAAAELGRTLVSGRVGVLAALLLALTPGYVRWGASGYADLPAAFFVTMALIFAVRLSCDYDDHNHDHDRDALLAGIMIGLAAWTKNSVLPIAAALALWLVYLYVGRRATLRTGIAALIGVLATAGWWYARNLVLWGVLYSSTAWTDQAQHTLKNLVPFLTYPERYGVAGIVYTLGLVWAVVVALRGAVRQQDGARQSDGARLLLVVSLPFMAAWWWLVSYDVRFLLAVLPGIAVLGAWALDALWSVLAARYSLRLPRAAQVALLLIVLVLALPAARKALTHKSELARDPFMDTVARHQIVLGPIYDVGRYLTALPAEGRVLTTNHFLSFCAADAGRLNVITGGLPDRAALAYYDYLVLDVPLPEDVTAADVELLTTLDRFNVYRVTLRSSYEPPK